MSYIVRPKSKVTFHQNIELGEREIAISVRASAHVFRERYGADFDGNRGEMRLFIEDIKIEDIVDQYGENRTVEILSDNWLARALESLAEDEFEKEWEK